MINEDQYYIVILIIIYLITTEGGVFHNVYWLLQIVWSCPLFIFLEEFFLIDLKSSLYIKVLYLFVVILFSVVNYLLSLFMFFLNF